MIYKLYLILTKKHLSFFRRILLASAYLKVRVLRFCINRFISSDAISSIKLLGYKVHVNEFGDFYWTFLEVFIYEEYYFKTDEISPVILDVGGHIGIATLYFKWLYPGAVITVFEPMPNNIEKLEKNINLNKLKDVFLVKKAVDEYDGVTSFLGSGRAGHIVNSATEDSIQVSVTTLSKYIDKKVSYCKMDIEGSESAVIMELGNKDKLQQIDHLVMEYHKKATGNKMSDIIASFEKVAMSVTFLGNATSLNLKKRDFTHIMLVAVRKIAS